jgi:PAS domain S-box-containing protein
LEAAANGIAITNASGTIEWVNPAFSAMTGFTLREAIGNNPRMLKSGKQDKEFYAALWKTISSGTVWRGEITNRRKDGTLYTEEMTVTPVAANGETITHYIAIKQDVTERKNIEHALEQAEARYRGIFEDAVIGIFRSTADGQFLMMNPAMEKMLGCDSPQQSRAVHGLFGDSPQSWELRLRIEAGGAVHDFEHQLSRRDGARVWVSINLRCIYNEDGTPAYYEGTAQDITSRKLAEEALHESEQRLRLFVEHAPAALAMFDRGMRYLQVSRRWRNDYGLGDRDLRGVSHYEVFPDIPERWKEGHRRGLAGEVISEKDDRFERSSGAVRWVRREIRPWHDKSGDIGGIVIFAEDVTERNLLEQQLRQAQKMDAVGRLAGGVAHDFNNMLGVITGYGELLKLRTDLDETVLHQIEEIYIAAKRAASLTHQLLAFSRKQIAQPRVLDLNEAIAKLNNMLQRLIGADIDLVLRFAGEQARVKMDESHIAQLIMNLAVNARDAMPSGGKLIIETEICVQNESSVTPTRPIPAGEYVHVTVTDTGCGMDERILSHLFEPFFTTKELGRGTGLGLSIVYGVVKQSEGFIWVSSAVGRGTSFEIYLPLQDAEVETVVKPTPIDSVTGSENVLVVEDDSALRSLMVEFLKRLGYSVLDADNGELALHMATNGNGRTEVLITDIVMPKMGGLELAGKLMSKLPDVRVIYTSGYSHASAVKTRPFGPGETFLQKPFGLFELGKKIREVIVAKPLTEVKTSAARGGSTS